MVDRGPGLADCRIQDVRCLWPGKCGGFCVIGSVSSLVGSCGLVSACFYHSMDRLVCLACGNGKCLEEKVLWPLSGPENSGSRWRNKLKEVKLNVVTVEIDTCGCGVYGTILVLTREPVLHHTRPFER